MFNNLSDRITASLKGLRGHGRLTEADVDKTIREIRRALLDADVAVSVVREFTGRVRERALGEEVSKALNPAQQVVKIVHSELVEVLGGATGELSWAKHPPTVIMLAGLQGAGKTTLAGKLATWMKGQGHTPLLVAADLQRPNAVNQLQIVGERAGVPVFAPEPGNGVGNPVLVAMNGVSTAQFQQHDVVIVDTAGRLGIDEEMMQQAREIRDAVNPHETLFVVDAMIGQDAARVAEAFRDGVGFTGVVLSKLDGDARGGAALSITGVTERPILFASTGESLDDFERFHPDRMANRILDMGDVLTLIEQAEKAFDQKEAEKAAQKLASGEDFTLDDFLVQMQQLKNMGSIKKMLGMLPNMGQYREQLENFDESELGRIEAIIRSMTPAERNDPKILNGSRRSRIAKGSGTTVQQVNQLLERFKQAQTMMRQMGRGMAGGGMPGMPGGPGMGMGKKSRGKAQQQPRVKKAKSKNPAKAAREQAEAAKRAAEGAGSGGSAFGAGALGSGGNGGAGQGAMPDLSDFDPSQLPPEMQKLFGQGR
ncbi:signal recognition particle protein [Brachybacterium sp. p3-SID1565]|uniref:signal recognition particle protein n=1 Tax=Brachybacterium sp. p3-SID1565 TaxID=2916046 RepID=UPI0021A8B753|nr:signal recognition particle protein [Brachybacterium sp. p3-SID1565]MCT1386193.1 signal recognition particle protein [Brachybacterium sp. p3-SID1565]